MRFREALLRQRSVRRPIVALRRRLWGRPRGDQQLFESLFSDGGRLEKVAGGFQFTEGPVWIPEERSLLFSDIPANRIFA